VPGGSCSSTADDTADDTTDDVLQIDPDELGWKADSDDELPSSQVREQYCSSSKC
jgi:hypothetical protein